MAAAAVALVLGAASGGVMARLVGGWALPILIGSEVVALAAAFALLYRKYRVARVAAGAWVSLVLWGWLLAQFPLMVPPSLTIDAAAAPRQTLVETMAVLVGGGMVLVPSLWYLLRVFKSRS
jgi:cytochrome d ubiquinol oxidase subunit II